MTQWTRQMIFDQLTDVFKDVFDDDSIVITDATTAHDIATWDSLNHINLVIAVEKKLKVKFNTAQVATMANVGAFVDAILSKLPPSAA